MKTAEETTLKKYSVTVDYHVTYSIEVMALSEEKAEEYARIIARVDIMHDPEVDIISIEEIT